MNYREFVSAKNTLERKRQLVKNLSSRSPVFAKALENYIEALITVKGHSWCMDVKNERRKMSRLLANTLKTLKHTVTS